jgi:hypothetical protein
LLKYAVAGLLLAVVVALGGIALISQINEPDAEAGPAPVVTVTVDEDGVSPAAVTIDRDRLVELRVTNLAAGSRVVELDHPAVESLPAAQNPLDGITSVPLPGLRFVVLTGGTNGWLVRIKESGTYEVTIAIPNRPETARTITLTVD